jgi:hypothetical protein
MIDLTHNISGCVKAEGKDKNVLILRKLDSPMQRFDGKIAGYEIEYRWLSKSLEDNQKNHVCVLGNEFTYWQKKELDFKKSLFDQVNLF